MAKKKLYRFLLYAAARMLAAAIYILPRSFALQLARLFGRLSYFIVWRQRNKVFENLRAAYGTEKSEAEFRRIAKGVFENFAQTAVEVLQFPKLNQEKVNALVDGREEVLQVYRDLLTEGKGIISITSHIGNWELLAGAVCLNQLTAVVVGRRIYYEPYNQWVVALRRAVNVLTIFRDESIREVIKILKRNHIIGILPDQDIDSMRGVFVPFFGRLAYTPEAPVRLALMTGAPMVSSFLLHQPGNRYRFMVTDVMRPKIETTQEDAIRKYTEQWMNRFENIIRQYPEQWAWMHHRWKTRPNPESRNFRVARASEARLSN